MIKNRFLLICLILIGCCLSSKGQQRPNLKNESWSCENQKHTWYASWIGYPIDSSLKSYPVYPYHTDYGVFMFRCSFHLSEKSADFKVHVSADNRYRLFVNGHEASFGPALGDQNNWYYETVDISPWLQEGDNVVAVEVVNFGPMRPVSMVSNQTAFILQGATENEHFINTGKGKWKVSENKSFTPIPNFYGEYIVVGPTDRIDAEKYPHGWNQRGFNDSTWLKPRKIYCGMEKKYATQVLWPLAARDIPPMEQKMETFKAIRSIKGIKVSMGKNLWEEITLPPHSEATLLLDLGHESVGYPEMVVSGGKNSKIKVAYAEALMDSSGNKGHRDNIEGKEVFGYYDLFLPDGGENRLFRPLWLRVFRFVELKITTKEEPLTVENYHHIFTAYPYTLEAEFTASDSSLHKIWDVAWRTMRNCSNETMQDGPYYEQLQYIGDSRMNAHFSYYLTRDDRLAKKFIYLFDQSRLPNGLTQSRYPSSVPQVIPPFSVIWIAAVHDYMMYKSDTAFIKQFLPGIQSVLNYFNRHIAPNGMISSLGYWNFVDWSPQWPMGIPPGADDGYSAVISLQVAVGFQKAAEIFTYFNLNYAAQKAQKIAKGLTASTYKLCFDMNKNLMADSPEKDSFSEQTNIFAILTDAIPEKQQNETLINMLNNNEITKATIGFYYYMFKVMDKTGYNYSIDKLFEPWAKMINSGLTTFPETNLEDRPRSECHVWSASPVLVFLSMIAGIKPGAPGFSEVIIAPQPGALNFVKATVPHPKGEIIIDLKFKNDNVTGYLILPDNVPGLFLWNNNKIILHGGIRKINVN